MTAGPGGATQTRIGIVGAGRSRNGLGPFLARELERSGARVVAVSGRDGDRAAANAAALAAQLGHDVAAADDVAALCGLGIDALVVASPAEHHLAALAAAAAHGLACLCEKPLVARAQLQAGLALVAQFAERSLLLAENCQWPFVLPAVAELYGPAPGPVQRPVQRVGMGLSPRASGAAAMVEDALPHLLSVVTASLPDAGTCELAACSIDDPAPAACTVRLRLAHGAGELPAELHLRHRRDQPRPAWLSIDGRRIDRSIGEGYAIAFSGNGRSIAVEDPLRQLVRSFVQRLQQRAAQPDPIATAAVARRLKLYGEVLAALQL